MKRLVEVHGERWDFIASHFPDRADVQCQHRWQKVVNPELVKGESGGNYVGWGHLLLGEARGRASVTGKLCTQNNIWCFPQDLGPKRKMRKL